MLVVDNSLLNANQLLEEHGVVYAEVVISLLQLLELLLGRDKLCVEQIHLLRWNDILRHDVGFPWGGRLSSDVVERILVVHLEIRMFELPSLQRSVTRRVQIGVDRPYPDAVRRCAALLVVVSHFVEVVLVQLAHETGEVAVLEVLRQDVLGEFLVLRTSSANAPFVSGRFFMFLPPAPQSCLLHCPIAPHSRLVGSPTS